MDVRLLGAEPVSSPSRLSGDPASAERAELSRRVSLSIESMAAFKAKSGVSLDERKTSSRPAHAGLLLAGSSRIHVP